MADERAGPSSTLKRWDVCPLGLVSRLDVRHKQEFERGAKKHYFKLNLCQHAVAKQEGKKQSVWLSCVSAVRFEFLGGGRAALWLPP